MASSVGALSLRVLGLGSFALISTAAMAQDNVPPTVKLRLERPIVSATKSFRAVLQVSFATGLHGYQNPPSDPSLIPLTVKLADKTFSVVSVAYPKGVPTKVAGESKAVNTYSGTIKILLTLKAPTKTGRLPLKVILGYQQCNEKACFPPQSVTATASVIISSKSGGALPPPSGMAPKIGG